jgi:hypothetical protein
LQEAGLNQMEANIFLLHCNDAIYAVSDMVSRRSERTGSISGSKQNIDTLSRKNLQAYASNNSTGIEIEWIRFITCCRVCLWHLFSS